MNLVYVLLSNDEHERNSTLPLLQTSGARVLHAANENEALDILNTHRDAELVVSAGATPIEDGILLARRLKAVRPTLRIIINGTESDARSATLPHNTMVVSGPFVSENLLPAIHDLIGR